MDATEAGALERLNARHEVDPLTGCWNWTGSKVQGGYGVISFRGRTIVAHRVALHLLRGFDLASPMVVMHTCDNPACINPDHLKPGTQRENAIDCIKKGRNRHPHGEAHAHARLTEDLVREMRRLHREQGLGNRRLSRRFGVGRTTVQFALEGRTWKHVVD